MNKVIPKGTVRRDEDPAQKHMERRMLANERRSEVTRRGASH
jgi:hypothetical protein